MIIKIIEWSSTLSSEAIIGSAALFLTLFTIFQTTKHNRLSVTPHLDTFLNSDNGIITLKLMNNGIGPAKINSIKVFIDENSYDGDLKDIAFNYIQAILIDGLMVRHAVHIEKDFSLLNGSEQQLIDIRVTQAGVTNQQINQNLTRINLLIKYSSYYGKKFKLDTRKTSWKGRLNS